LQCTTNATQATPKKCYIINIIFVNCRTYTVHYLARAGQILLPSFCSTVGYRSMEGVASAKHLQEKLLLLLTPTEHPHCMYTMSVLCAYCSLALNPANRCLMS